jgi:hypothetical protein
MVMRFAFVTPQVADRHDVSTSCIDAQWLAAAVESGSEILVLVDHETPGSDLVRRSGCEVAVSPKRPTALTDGTNLSANHVQAQRLAEFAAGTHVDFVLYSSDAPTDLSWHESSLGDIPRGVAVGESFGIQRLALDDGDLFARVGRQLWATSGFVASADFLVADAPAESYGFASAPPRLAAAEEVSLPAAPSSPSLAVVVALAVGFDGLAFLASAVEEHLNIDAATSIVVVTHREALGVAQAYWPQRLARSTVFVPPGDDGVAASFLEKADVVIAPGPADLAVPAVADAARRVGAVVLDNGGSQVPTLDGATIPATRSRSKAVAVPVVGSLEPVAGLVDGLSSEEDIGMIVLHGDGVGDEAIRVGSMRGLAEVDIVVLAASDDILGTPDPARPHGGFLGVHRDSWPALITWLGECHDLPSLVSRSLSPSLAGQVRLLMLPTDAPTAQLPPPQAGTPWIGSRPMLPTPRFAVGGSVDVADGVKLWAASHGWSDRLRLALPWRWGLLERAMRRRW